MRRAGWHLGGRRRCLRYAGWEDGQLRCRRCGRLLALRVRVGLRIHLVVCPAFGCLRDRIEKRRWEPAVAGDPYLGEIRFWDFDDLRVDTHLWAVNAWPTIERLVEEEAKAEQWESEQLWEQAG